MNDGARLKGDVTFVGGLYKHLSDLVLRPYDFGRLLYSRRFQQRNKSISKCWEAASEETTMHLTSLHLLFLIPVGLALAFMLWVLWNLTQQLAHRDESTDKQPMISIRVGDRYPSGTQPTRTRGSDHVSRMARESHTGARPGYSASREYFQPASAPTLGMGLRRMSSSTIQGARK